MPGKVKQMASESMSAQVKKASDAMAPVYEFFGKYQSWTAGDNTGSCDFAVGNPHEMPLPAYVAALEKALPPQDKDWFAYKMNESPAVETVASSLSQQFKRPFSADDIFMTNGATGALQVILKSVINQGDEVIFISPPWFFYEGMIINSGGQPVRAGIDPNSFDLDLEAIERAISKKTALIIINSPNNPTGKIYPPETLKGLAEILTHASAQNGRPIYLLSDEAYRQIVYDDQVFPSPTSYYPYSLIAYTYGKTLLTPGQRLGYIALSPEMPNREEVREVVFSSQILSGFASSNALLQHALPDLQPLSIDIKHLQAKRDKLVTALRDSGYEVHSPEGTFYLLPRSPLADDVAFTDLLAEDKVYCLAGKIVEMPGYFRISLTANDEMIDRAIPKFAKARQRALEMQG